MRWPNTAALGVGVLPTFAAHPIADGIVGRVDAGKGLAEGAVHARAQNDSTLFERWECQ